MIRHRLLATKCLAIETTAVNSMPCSIWYAAWSTINLHWYSSTAESAISHWMPCFSASTEPWRVPLEGAIDHHVERDLGLADPPHAVREAGRAEAVLAEEMALTAPAEHVRRRDPEVLDQDLAVVVATRHRLDVTDDVPALRRQVDDEARVGGLRDVGIVLGAGDEHRELGAAGAGDEPLVAVDHPLVAVLVGERPDQRRVGAGDLRLGHREAAAGRAVAQWPQVPLLLLVGAPVQQGVLVALVGRLGVDDERADRHLRRLGRHRRHRGRPEPHAAPLGRHVREPEPPLVVGLLAELDDRPHDLRPVVLIGGVPFGPHTGRP